MNAQEIFDKAVGGVVKQGAPAATTDGSCYLRLNGLKCAVGWLIPDDKYDPNMERYTVKYIVDNWPGAIGSEVSETEARLLNELQIAHDTAANSPDFIEAFKRKCRVVARRFGLDPAEAARS